MMSPAHLAKAALIMLAIMVLIIQPALAASLKPFKDELFSYQTILEDGDRGAFVKVHYQEMRDINKRDEIPERRVKSRYVSLSVRRHQVMESLDTGGRQLDVMRVGEIGNANFAVIFIHGRGGDRRLGANDFSFGGNFNRLKNLVIENQGVYLAPSMTSFGDAGSNDLKALVADISMRAPNIPIILSCASMGSFLCWTISRDAPTVKRLGGMMIMGGVSDPGFTSSPAFAGRLPVFFSHGSNDSVYKAGDQLAFYRSLKAQDYPSRFVLFETGSHGTPVRMTDWRDSLNWFLMR